MNPTFKIWGAALSLLMLASSCGKTQSVAAQSVPDRIWPPSRPGYVNPVPAENALPGDARWADGPDAVGHQLEGYGDRISATAGETIGIHASADIATTANWVLYRLGWYSGAGARAVRAGGPVSLGPQLACPMQPVTGLIRCDWSTSVSLDISSSDLSGLYALKLIRQDGRVRFIPFVVVDRRPADLLFQASVQTHEAYNAWGGTSLYTDASGKLPHTYATKVSFDRPFDTGRGMGQMTFFELPMARFLERYGYDVSYVTNVDMGTADPPFVDRAGMFMSVGHDEYWSGRARDVIDHSRDEGVPLAFFSANTAYWKVRYEDFRSPDNPRTMVCYKGGDDPLDASASGLFRGNDIQRPENALIGVMYESTQLASFPFVVGDATGWIYAGTGLNTGDAISGIVGNEFDRRYTNGFEPPGVTVLARSPVIDRFARPKWSEAVAYRARSGALVFASGSIYWSRGLDHHAAIDARMERMTANVFHEGLRLAIPQALETITAPPSGTEPRPGPVRATTATLMVGLSDPAGIAVVPGSAGSLAGQIVVSLPNTAQVVVVDPVSRTTAVLAGDGQASTSNAYDGVPGASARFSSPVGVAVDSLGRVYVADSVANVIRRIDSDSSHTTTTFVGKLGTAGSADGVGEAARFSQPEGISLDPSAAVLYVADTANHRIRAVDLTTRAVKTIAGSAPGDSDGPGLLAHFNFPTGLAAAPDGRLFVLSAVSQRIKVLLPDAAHTVVTLAGSGEGFSALTGSGGGGVDGAGTVARLSPQLGVAWTGTFLAISDGPALRVRALVPGASAATTQVYTVAFSGTFGSSDGFAMEAKIGPPGGLAAAADGSIYVADGANGAIRVIRQGQ